MGRRVKIMIVAVFVTAAIAAFCCRRQYLWLPVNPAYTFVELHTLTPADVEHRLGPQSVDPRRERRKRDWNESEDGPLYFGYYGAFRATVTIVFRNGRVVEVRRFFN